jgi:signal transduction histidine kinase
VLAAVAVTAMALVLLWYRRAPLAALGGACAAYLAWFVAASPNGPLVPLVILLVAVFSVAAREGLRPGVLGLAGALAVLLVPLALSVRAFADYIFVSTFILGAWAAGRGVHGRQRRADEMESRAIVAEREREARARVAVIEERARIARELHDIVARRAASWSSRRRRRSRLPQATARPGGRCTGSKRQPRRATPRDERSHDGDNGGHRATGSKR